MQEVRFAPMSSMEIVSRAFAIFAGSALPLMCMTLMVMVPYALARLVLYAMFGGVQLLLLELLTGFIYFFVFAPFLEGAIVHLASAAHMGVELDVLEAFKRSYARLGVLLWTNVLAGMFITVGLVFCLVPGIVLAVWYALRSQVVMLEPVSKARNNLFRARGLMEGNFLRMLPFVVLMVIAMVLLGIALEAVIAVVPMLRFILTYADELLFTPLWTICLTLYYYDIRVRQERFGKREFVEALTMFGQRPIAGLDLPTGPEGIAVGASMTASPGLHVGSSRPAGYEPKVMGVGAASLEEFAAQRRREREAQASSGPACNPDATPEELARAAEAGAMNCWEYHQCEREPGGAKVEELGICPASIHSGLDGTNEGRNGGRACWTVTGTLCHGERQDDYLSKLHMCLRCDFRKQVMREQGGAFDPATRTIGRLPAPVPGEAD